MKRDNAASVRQRLLNLSREQGRPFKELMQFFVMERFLYRLGQSAHADRFVLKGALMLQLWGAPEARPTRDIDVLGHTENTPEAVLERIREILQAEASQDGIVFDLDSLQAERITKDAEYQGVRVLGWATLSGARARLQIDIGFGDVVVPEPVRRRYPVLLDFPPPEVLCYSRESAIAEKFQAMVALGELNSRMKDFYDIWLLSRQFEFDLGRLAASVTATFDQRETPLPERPLFTGRFETDKQRQWQAFIERLGDRVPAEPEFGKVIAVLEHFLGGVLCHLANRRSDNARWRAGRWQESGATL